MTNVLYEYPESCAELGDCNRHNSFPDANFSIFRFVLNSRVRTIASKHVIAKHVALGYCRIQL